MREWRNKTLVGKIPMMVDGGLTRGEETTTIPMQDVISCLSHLVINPERILKL